MKLHSHRCCHTLQDVQAHHRPDRCLRFGRLGPLRLRQLRRWPLRWCPSWLRRDQGSLNPQGPKGQGLNSNLRGLRQVSKPNSLTPSFKFEHGLSGIWPKSWLTSKFVPYALFSTELGLKRKNSPRSFILWTLTCKPGPTNNPNLVSAQLCFFSQKSYFLAISVYAVISKLWQ